MTRSRTRPVYTLFAGGQIVVPRVLGIVAAEAAIALDPASNTGAPNHPDFTNVTTPKFDVQVNQAGSITLDFDGNPAHDQTQNVPNAGTYQFTAPTLAAGNHTATATFDSATGGVTQSTVNDTVDTTRPFVVAAMTPTGTVGTSVSAGDPDVQRAGGPRLPRFDRHAHPDRTGAITLIVPTLVSRATRTRSLSRRRRLSAPTHCPLAPA